MGTKIVDREIRKRLFLMMKDKEFDLDDTTIKVFCKRAVYSARKYISSKDINDTDDIVLLTKLDFLIQKLDQDAINKILIDETLRIKELFDTSIYELNPILRKEKDDIMSKIIDVDANACDLYRCPRCKARHHTYKEVVARSIDEPKIVKCICLMCGQKFNKG